MWLSVQHKAIKKLRSEELGNCSSLTPLSLTNKVSAAVDSDLLNQDYMLADQHNVSSMPVLFLSSYYCYMLDNMKDISFEKYQMNTSLKGESGLANVVLYPCNNSQSLHLRKSSMFCNHDHDWDQANCAKLDGGIVSGTELQDNSEYQHSAALLRDCRTESMPNHTLLTFSGKIESEVSFDFAESYPEYSDAELLIEFINLLRGQMKADAYEFLIRNSGHQITIDVI